MSIVAVYADGGVIQKNPSPIGGTWAFCFVDAQNERIVTRSGSVSPAEFEMATISNNLTEFLALLYALEAVPAGWIGSVYTDSGVTLQRFADPWNVSMKGIPTALVDRARAVGKHVGGINLNLLGGHPNRAELAAGVRKDGKRVSEHNVWCDQECTRVGEEYVNKLGTQEASNV